MRTISHLIRPAFYPAWYANQLSSRSCYALERAGFASPDEVRALPRAEVVERLSALPMTGKKTVAEILEWLDAD